MCNSTVLTSVCGMPGGGGGLFSTCMKQSVGSDTCVSLHEYLQNPVNTTLEALLPCAALASANHTYLEARIGIDTVIRTVCQLGFFPFSFA
jgi:hypothetical protein